MMKARISKILSVALLVMSFGLVSASVATIAPTTVVHADTISDIRDGVTGSGGGGQKNQGNRLPDIIRAVINILLFLIGAFAVIMIVIAGFRMVTANGDSNTVSQARNTIIYALIGLAVAFLAFALVDFVIRQIS